MLPPRFQRFFCFDALEVVRAINLATACFAAFAVSDVNREGARATPPSLLESLACICLDTILYVFSDWRKLVTALKSSVSTVVPPTHIHMLVRMGHQLATLYAE